MNIMVEILNSITGKAIKMKQTTKYPSLSFLFSIFSDSDSTDLSKYGSLKCKENFCLHLVSVFVLVFLRIAYVKVFTTFSYLTLAMQMARLSYYLLNMVLSNSFHCYFISFSCLDWALHIIILLFWNEKGHISSNH